MKREVIIDKNRDFKGFWVSDKIHKDRNLTSSEKIILIEIINLSKNSECYATNRHFADFLGIAKGTAANIIYSLRKKGYISIDITYKGDTKEIEKRVINYLDPYSLSLNNEEGIHSKMNTPIHSKVKDKYTLVKNTFKDTNYLVSASQQDNTLFSENDNNLIPEEKQESETKDVSTRDKIVYPKFIWHSDKQYNDYVENTLKQQVIEIVEEHNSEKNDTLALYDTYRIIYRFFEKYKDHRNEYHPIIRKQKLKEIVERIADTSEFRLLEEYELDLDYAYSCIDRFFEAKRKNDYKIYVMFEKVTLNVILGELTGFPNYFDLLNKGFEYGF